MERMTLHEFRTSKGWSLDAAADQLGLAKSYISELERGVKPWTLKAARKVEKATKGKLKAAELLGFERAG